MKIQAFSKAYNNKIDWIKTYKEDQEWVFLAESIMQANAQDKKMKGGKRMNELVGIF